jgi:hypothetical protein
LTCAEGYAIVTRGKQPFSQEPFSQEPFSQEPFSQEPFSQEPVNGIIFDATSVRQLLLVSLLFYQPTYGLVASRCLTPEL